MANMVNRLAITSRCLTVKLDETVYYILIDRLLALHACATPFRFSSFTPPTIYNKIKCSANRDHLFS